MSVRLRNLNPYELHKFLVNEYILNQAGATKKIERDTSKDKTDLDVIRENSKFLWEDEPADTWEKQLAKKYYDKLFKEYCICDLSRYKENKVALRWRTEQEVVIGRGQFQCGNKRCPLVEGLRTWEVNFTYLEDGMKKNALVKLRLCTSCSDKLNYHSKKREVKRLKKNKRKSKNGNSVHDKTQSESAPQVSTGPPQNSEELPRETTADEPSKSSEPSTSLWKQDTMAEEKSRDEEFEEYLEELLL